MNVAAERDLCVGAGMCLLTAEAVFDQDEGGIVLLLASDVPPEHVEATRRAVMLCPSGALRVIGE